MPPVLVSKFITWQSYCFQHDSKTLRIDSILHLIKYECPILQLSRRVTQLNYEISKRNMTELRAGVLCSPVHNTEFLYKH